MRAIIVDFNTLQIDPQRVLIGIEGTPADTQVAGLHSGERVLLDGGDLLVEGILSYDVAQRAWYAVPDWTTRRDVSIEAAEVAQ